MGRAGLTKGEVRLVRYGDFDVKRHTVHVRTARGEEREARSMIPNSSLTLTASSVMTNDAFASTSFIPVRSGT